MAKKKLLFSILLLLTVISPSFLAFNNTPSQASQQNTYPPFVCTYKTDEPYQQIDQLLQPPPTPIWEEPPHIIYANETLANLISEMEGNYTIGKIPRLSKPLNSSSVIDGRPVVVYETTASTETVTPMSHEIIDSDTKSGRKLKVSAVLYKDTGEKDPKWDYYAVRATIEDIYAKNDFWKGVLFAKIYLLLPKWAEEVPTNHKPEAGFRLSEGSASFGYQGISFNLKLPAYSIGYETSTTKYNNYLYVQWSFDGGWGPFAYWYFVFKDYAEASIGIRVPQGKKPYCYVGGWAAWYRFWLFFFSYDSSENVYWCYVDPPGVESTSEVPEPPTQTPPSTTPGPNPKVPAGTAIDGFLYVITYTDSTYSSVKYLSMSGMGQDYYGWHAGTYSLVYFFAAVSNNSNPVANAPVHFYLVDPNSIVYDLGVLYTDEDGIAGCVVFFDPRAGIQQGMWWFIPVYGSIQDTCGFSYGYCLLITGYTYMACWNEVYIEDAFLVPENNIVELTASPPPNYKFKYWWINFYYISYSNPIYVYMDFDCIVLARFDPISTGYDDGYYGRGGFRGRPALLY